MLDLRGQDMTPDAGANTYKRHGTPQALWGTVCTQHYGTQHSSQPEVAYGHEVLPLLPPGGIALHWLYEEGRAAQLVGRGTVVLLQELMLYWGADQREVTPGQPADSLA